MFYIIKAIGGVLMKDTGTDPRTIMGSGVTWSPGEFPVD
jgi:hypothetical protein